MASFGPGWTLEDQTKKRDLDKRIQVAHNDGKKYEHKSAGYYKNLQEVLNLEAEHADLLRRVNERAYSEVGNTYFLKRKQEHQDSFDEFVRRARNAERMAKRQSVRQSFNSFAAAKDLRAARAAFVTLLSSLKENTSRGNQAQFKANLADRYGVKSGEGSDKYFWTPVHGWTLSSFVKAAHIFPLQYGQTTMTYVFGKEAEGEINDARNGLFLPIRVEEKFDKYEVIIVPCGQHSNPPEYKWVVLDKNILNTECIPGQMTFKDLHGQRLVFQNDFRPRARYLYFHYLEAMRHRAKIPRMSGQRPSDHPEITMQELTKAWGTSGSYMRDNMILAFIEDLDHDLGDKFKTHVKDHSFAASDDDEAAFVKAVSQLDIEEESDDEDD